MFDIDQYHLHDLTHTYSPQIEGYSDTVAKSLNSDGWNAKWLRIYSHAGTHMDAPHHFGVSKETIDMFPLTSLMGKAHIVRIDNVQHAHIIDIAQVALVEKDFTEGDSLLIQTRWSEKIGQDIYRDELPRISRDLALWCVEKKVKILGVEAPSVADVNNLTEVTQIHQILLGGSVIIVEGLKNLHRIKADQVFLIALPLKIRNGDGSPARVIAFEKR